MSADWLRGTPAGLTLRAPARHFVQSWLARSVVRDYASHVRAKNISAMCTQGPFTALFLDVAYVKGQ